MPLRGSASCSAFDVSTRKVPSLALVPRGYLKPAARDKKKAGCLQPGEGVDKHRRQQERNERGSFRVEVDVTERKQSLHSLSPPRPARRQTLSDTLEEEAEEQEAQSDNPLQIKEEEEGEQDENVVVDDDGRAELRLGERFLNMMALMARLSTQSLGENPPSPSRLARTNTERSMSLIRSSTERTLISVAPGAASPSPPPSPPQIQLSSPVKSPPKSPKRTVLEVSKRLPRALQGPLTFDICMLLPTPMDERKSPLRSPIRRKRLRKRVRRRKLRRRARRTWQASHASWPPHASADYIVDHSRQDIAGINAARLVERLGERKVNTQTLPRVISMPLPPLRHNIRSEQNIKSPTEVNDSVPSDNDEQESDGHDSEGELDDDEEGDDVEDDTQDEDAETPPPSSDSTETTISLPQDELDVDQPALQLKKRPLYHQPAWISPELHTWLVESGLFATKLRHELVSSEI
ncbi:RasGEF domain-containing serine/threonine-protein kinase X [Phytophthora cinnamomi]|uniref:RasGEF domain-containing serine/threonine-protein kinase X n=1 Tax=Phytophthora cinnamomi TaxID=4785 RepID=UPI00355A2225|nr:RasGEF domain-containing serine/threonine-protein kinase X [Phytophthora cinnamomi]